MRPGDGSDGPQHVLMGPVAGMHIGKAHGISAGLVRAASHPRLVLSSPFGAHNGTDLMLPGSHGQPCTNVIARFAARMAKAGAPASVAP